MRESIDISEVLVWLGDWRDLHRAGGTGSGRFALRERGPIHARSCADFTVIDYTTGPWPPGPSEHEARVGVLRGFQSADSGVFDLPAREEEAGGSDALEMTGYMFAALELLASRPLQPVRALDHLRAPAGISEFWGSLEWSRPRLAACRAAAVATCFAVDGDVGPEWFDRFFGLLDEAADAETGLWCAAGADVKAAVTGSFELLAVYERFRRPMPHPKQAIGTVVDLQDGRGLLSESGPDWPELAAAYVLRQAFGQCGSRYRSVEESLAALAGTVGERLSDEGFRAKMFEDPHHVAGALSLVALLSKFPAGSVRSPRPLRLFADRLVYT